MKKELRYREKIVVGGRVWKWVKGGQKVPASSSKLSHGSLMYSMVTVISTVYIFQIC